MFFLKFFYQCSGLTTKHIITGYQLETAEPNKEGRKMCKQNFLTSSTKFFRIAQSNLPKITATIESFDGDV